MPCDRTSRSAFVLEQHQSRPSLDALSGYDTQFNGVDRAPRSRGNGRYNRRILIAWDLIPGLDGFLRPGA